MRYFAILAQLGENTQIKFFAQPGFDYSQAMHKDSLKKGNPYFRSGQFITYLTAQISDKISVAAETNLHYMVLEGEPSVELERLYLRYLFNDNLALRIGKTYNPFGYWNLNYDLALVYQPTISRPAILQPSHDAGFTQTRDVGVMLEGEHYTKANLFFKVFVANGRGKNGGLMGNTYTTGNSVSTNLQIGTEPIEGLKVSISGIYNPLNKGNVNELGMTFTEDNTYSALAGSVSFFRPDKKLELIGEYYDHINAFATLGTFHTTGAVLYLGYKATSKITPYFFFETVRFDIGNPFYPAINVETANPYSDMTNLTLGMRYRVNPTTVFKVEAGSTEQKYVGYGMQLRSQLAFSF